MRPPCLPHAVEDMRKTHVHQTAPSGLHTAPRIADPIGAVISDGRSPKHQKQIVFIPCSATGRHAKPVAGVE
jgi:hypothetical protein